MMNQKEIDAAIKRFDDPNFDFESEMYRILGKLKKSAFYAHTEEEGIFNG